MTDSTGLQRAIVDARALLDTMIVSDLSRVLVSSGGVDIFISRHAEPSPLLVRSDASPAPVGEQTEDHSISAPHVATLKSVVAPGDQLSEGQVVATIAVLDQPQELTSSVSGRVAKVSAVAGDLIEYGQELVVIEVALP